MQHHTEPNVKVMLKWGKSLEIWNFITTFAPKKSNHSGEIKTLNNNQKLWKQQKRLNKQEHSEK